MLRLPLVLVLNLLTALRFMLNWVLYRFGRFFQRRPRYVQLRLKPQYPLLRPTGWSKHFSDVTSYFDLDTQLKALADDPDIAGLILHIDHVQMSGAIANELAERIEALGTAGKHVVSHCDMPMNRDYQLALAAQDVLLTPAGRMYTFQPRFEQYFVSGLFNRLGIGVQFVHIGAFKAAANRFLREKMPTSHRLMMEELHTDMTTLSHQWVRSRRGEVDESWTRMAPMDARQAHAKGLIDGIAFRSDVKSWIETRPKHVHLGNDQEERERTIDVIQWDDYIDGGRPRLKLRPMRRRKTIAVLDLSGMITAAGMKMSSGPMIDPDDVIPAVERLRDDPHVAGVLVHISSPGGSALSSDLIWRALESLRSRKPVVSYCSDVAASGGYYLAVATDAIYCRNETIMGSIGVIAGKFSAGAALRPHGVNIETIATDDASTFMSVFTPFPAETLTRLRDDSRAFYRRFLNRVGQSRNIPKHRLHRFARGRVYTGRAALKRGLVDGTGGMNEAMTHLLRLAELSADNIEIKTISHRSQSLKEVIRSSALKATGVEPLLEEQAVLRLFRREPILALSLLRTAGT